MDEKADAFIRYLLQSNQKTPWEVYPRNVPEESPPKRKESAMEKCPECKKGFLEPTILGKGKICTSCCYITMEAPLKFFRMIAMDTEADDNLEAGLIMALKVRG